MLKAGYLGDWRYHQTLSGCPQGGVVSPILSSIYLDRLDKFAETVLIPEYTRGTVRRMNPDYAKVTAPIGKAFRRGDRTEARQLRAQRRGIPRGDVRDPRYRRLRYIRYADDHLIGFTGPKAEAEQIKQRLAAFLRDDLKLELSQDKTLITHARTQAASFLGYETTVQHSRDRPMVNGVTRLRVPQAVIKAKCAPQDAGRRAPLHRDGDGPQAPGCHHHAARAAHLLPGHRHARGQETTGHTVRRHSAETEKKTVITDRLPDPPIRRKELTQRLRARQCEYCETLADMEIHQVRKLADLTRAGRPQPRWAHLMARMRRKTLVVCSPCHQAIHHGHPTAYTA
jgi:hypothetical protein